VLITCEQRRNDNVVIYASDSTANFIYAINFNARERERERDKILYVLEGSHRKSRLSDSHCLGHVYKILKDPFGTRAV
jgi:hypothetical protein